jgi:hypothetical protein
MWWPGVGNSSKSLSLIRFFSVSSLLVKLRVTCAAVLMKRTTTPNIVFFTATLF